MKKINFKKEQVPFTQVANVVAQLKTISLKAKGIYLYMASKPEGWDFSAYRMSKESTDGERSILSGIKELEDACLLIRQKLPSGRMEYTLKTEPHCELEEKPKRQKRSQAKQQSAKTASIINKENKKERDNKNKELATASPFASQIVDIIHAMEQIDSKNKRYYGNKTQRASCEFLIKEKGYEKTMNMIMFYVAYKPQADQYFPDITNPYDLVEKWGKIENYFNRKNAEVEKVKNDLAGHFM